MHYRLRVVDLVEALAKQRSTSPLLVLVLLPLFGIVRSSSTLEQEIQTKAAKILRQIVQGKKDAVSPPTPDAALEALAELHTVSQTVDAADLATLCSQTAIYLVKAALASPTADASTSATIVKLYGDSFETYLSKKNSKTKVQPLLTIEFCRRSPACAWPLFARVVKLAAGKTSSVNAYRRMQAFDVAQALLTSYASLVRSLVLGFRSRMGKLTRTPLAHRKPPLQNPPSSPRCPRTVPPSSPSCPPPTSTRPHHSTPRDSRKSANSRSRPFD
jgi:DNA polymerase phi